MKKPSQSLFFLVVFGWWSLLLWLWLCRLGLGLPVLILRFFVARLSLALGLYRRRRPGLWMRPSLLRTGLRTRLRRRLRTRLVIGIQHRSARRLRSPRFGWDDGELDAPLESEPLG